ncbi:hypothetical protein, partial [Asticcacaulis sp. W401b]|uniref:hypothetical protein n=1 Tax=Asticcacaulis sp. W401b TaxID=3388666 RepID=UPI003970DB9E
MTPEEYMAQGLKDQIASAATALSVTVKHLGKPKDPVEPNVSFKGKTYETWVALEIAARLKGDTTTVEVINHEGDVDPELRVRGGPGYLVSPKATGDQPCHLRISSPVRTLDLHISLQHKGQSGALHELDISVVPYKPTIKMLAGQSAPYIGPRLLGLELKNYAM